MNRDVVLLLRPGRACDEHAVAEMHARCSLRTMFCRYHAGMRTVPRRWLHRLLAPPRGRTIVVQNGLDIIALGQLLHMSPGTAEVSLLVEDAWQRRDIGTMLLKALADQAAVENYRELVAWCLPSEKGLLRTAARAGLATSARREDGLLRVTVKPARVATQELDNARKPSFEIA